MASTPCAAAWVIHHAGRRPRSEHDADIPAALRMNDNSSACRVGQPAGNL